MKHFSTLIALVAAVGFLAAPAQARSSFILDGAGMFSAGTVSSLNTRLTNFNTATHKEVLVETVPSLNGAPLQDAAQKEFAQQQVNGVLIFIAKDDRRDIIVPDRAGVQAGWFDSETLRSIRQSMEAQFKDGDFDGGITTAVSGILGIYRSHMSPLNGANGAALPATRSNASAPAFRLNGFWLIVILIAAFLVLRSLMRAMSTPRQYIGAPGAPGRPGAPAQGYGPGYYGGGGGGFWSGLLGGLGGAWLGNEMFRGGGGGGAGGASAGGWGSGDSGGAGGGGDSGGWSSDAGQADVGGSSGGDWSGGGFGGGDSGGDFGGGDGGGGGDSGGGW